MTQRMGGDRGLSSPVAPHALASSAIPSCQALMRCPRWTSPP